MLTVTEEGMSCQMGSKRPGVYIVTLSADPGSDSITSERPFSCDTEIASESEAPSS